MGVLVAIAGAGYLIDSLGGLLYATYTFELASLTFVGEVVLMVWLLVFAARRPPNERTPRMITGWRASAIRRRSVVAAQESRS